MSTRRVEIVSEYLLEGILSYQEPSRGVLILHPHPLYGGNMENNVVKAINNAFKGKGFTTLRFNFRGVGESSGFYAEGEGEKQDALCALNYLLNLLQKDARIVVAGYSFGAWIASRIAKERKISDLFLVAYPFSSYGDPNLQEFNGNLYLVGGLFDDISPHKELLNFYKSYPNPNKSLKLIASSHFFWGKEQEIINFIVDLF